MSERLPIRFIINPTSGPRSSTDVTALIEEHLDREKYAPELVYTEFAGHATELAEQAAKEGCAVVVAVGGDGTVNEVAQGILHSDTALAILPRGSGNGLARHMLIPMKLQGAINNINQGHTTHIDSASINEHPFFTTAGIGFDAYISSVFAGNKKRGLKTYVELILKEVLSYRHQPIHVHLEDKNLSTNCFVMAFANAAQYGNNAYIAPMADIRDGLLDVCLIRQLDLLKAINLSYSMLTNQLASADSAEYFKTSNLRIHTDQEIMYHADGEYKGTAKEFTVAIKPSSLKVVTPL